uniref:3-isopropylmalate dehydratase small subunit n=1 Tax=Vaginimicrobium propionicum TaxID=1871034 RepID=UPI000970FDC4|nr:3-isopropylmalate dehydratase small subunit [Vaginimicrobium propionicum]
MEKFQTHSGVAVPLRRSNVDTDQIIPAVYLKRITRSGFEDGLFASWRVDDEFVLNKSSYKTGSILIVGPDFGTGSSREHAVWALQNYGFKVIIGTRFGPIFKNNAGKAGLLIAVVTDDVVKELWEYTEANPGVKLTVNLADQSISAGEQVFSFEIDAYTKQRLLAGLDDIAATLRHEDEIAAFEAKRPVWKLRTLPKQV